MFEKSVFVLWVLQIQCISAVLFSKVILDTAQSDFTFFNGHENRFGSRSRIKHQQFISHQHIRLVDGLNPWSGILQIFDDGFWREICSDHWHSTESIVACNQLGYDRFQDFSPENRHFNILFSKLKFRCRGTEGDLFTCLDEQPTRTCNTKKYVRLNCLPNYVSACDPDEIYFGGFCYQIVKENYSRKVAEKYCFKQNKLLLEITSNSENVFLSNHLIHKFALSSDFTKLHVAAKYAKDLLVWKHSQIIMPTKDGLGNRNPRWLPPVTNMDRGCGILASKVNQTNLEYFFLSASSCDLKLPFICKSQALDVGCVENVGRNYEGSASITRKGRKCLPWAMWQTENQLIHSPISEEAVCRNPDKDEKPWCFVDDATYDYCDIPSCSIEESVIARSICPAGSYICGSGSCYTFYQSCNGVNDCPEGDDEKNCPDNLQYFKKFEHLRLRHAIFKKISGISEERCSRYCVKSLDCLSFAYIKDIRAPVCLFYKSSTLTQILAFRENSTYYELDKTKSNLHFQVRLKTKANVENEGIVEVRVHGQWGYICDDFWDIIDATVVCKQLGYELGAIGAYGGFEVENGAPIIMDDVKCFGNETSLDECSFGGFGKHDCLSNELAGVKCQVNAEDCTDSQFKCKDGSCMPLNFLCDSYKDCKDGSDEITNKCKGPLGIRLYGGRDRTSGRVEIRRHGIWGTICDDQFSAKSAAVVCKMLGFSGYGEVLEKGSFPPGIGPIWIDELDCAGSESSVQDCTRFAWGQNDCIHDEDVAVQCTSNKSSGTVPPTPHYTPEQCGVRIYQPSFEFSQVNSPLKDTVNDNGTIVDDESSVSNPANNSDHYPHLSLKNSSIEIVPTNVARIIGGISAHPGSYPWQVDIRIKVGSRSQHWCGGAIISEHFVLTAAHCMKTYPADAYLIRIGESHQEMSDENESDFEVDQLIIHENFNKGTKLNNDIALIKINSRFGIKFNAYIQPVCLPPRNASYVEGTKCEISGWGSTNIWRSSPTLQSAVLPILPIDICRRKEIYGEVRVTENMFCAGYLSGGIDSCKGDSGGPFVCNYKKSFTLFGIISWGQGCAKKNRPGVYVKISKFIPWIEKNMQL